MCARGGMSEAAVPPGFGPGAAGQPRSGASAWPADPVAREALRRERARGVAGARFAFGTARRRVELGPVYAPQPFDAPAGTADEEAAMGPPGTGHATEARLGACEGTPRLLAAAAGAPVGERRRARAAAPLGGRQPEPASQEPAPAAARATKVTPREPPARGRLVQLVRPAVAPVREVKPEPEPDVGLSHIEHEVIPVLTAAEVPPARGALIPVDQCTPVALPARPPAPSLLVSAALAEQLAEAAARPPPPEPPALGFLAAAPRPAGAAKHAPRGALLPAFAGLLRPDPPAQSRTDHAAEAAAHLTAAAATAAAPPKRPAKRPAAAPVERRARRKRGGV